MFNSEQVNQIIAVLDGIRVRAAALELVRGKSRVDLVDDMDLMDRVGLGGHGRPPEPYA